MVKEFTPHEDLSSSQRPKSGLSPGYPGPRDWRQFKQARLFSTEDRATLTFFHGQAVASIHFDRNRGEIFYRGHNVKNMTLTEEQWGLLQQFGDYLKTHGAPTPLHLAYEDSLASLLPKR